MSFIMVLTLSGSLMYILYLIVRRCFKDKFEEQSYYRLLKINIFYFLIPLPFLKEIYAKFFYILTGTNDENFSVYYSQEDMLIFVEDAKIFLNKAVKVNAFIIGIWVLGTMAVCLCFVNGYMNRRNLLINCDSVDMPHVQSIFESLKKEYKINANAKLKICDAKISPFTIGFIKPIIFYSGEATMEEHQMMLTHELIHIKNGDLFWKFTGLVVVIAHWYNPFAWLLRKELDKVCEYACDEKVVCDKNDQYSKKYAVLLIKNVLRKKGEILEVSLSKDAQEVERRMMKVLIKGSKKNNFWGMVLAIGLFVINSVTVFAYEDVEVLRGWSEEFHDCDIAFTPDGEVLMYSMPEVESYKYVYDFQFVDEEGNIFAVHEDVEACVECTHSYVSGTVQKHVKSSGEGCRIYYYNAKRCTKCGDVVLNDFLYDIGYDVCTH